MDLPDYFITDLPAEAEITPVMVREACQTLRANRRQFLRDRPTRTIIDAISAVADDWQTSGNPYRNLALQEGPGATGFSRETLETGLDMFFEGINPDNLQALVEQDLGRPDRLEGMMAEAGDAYGGRRAQAQGPELLVHVTGGQIPNPTISSLILGLLVRSAQFVKCAAGTSFLPTLFCHALREIEPKLGACIELAAWRGGTRPLDDALFAEADCLTATGRDETLLDIARRLPVKLRFLGYGHRLSFGYVAADALTGRGMREWAARAARDVAAWNQLGCLSPHAIFVEARAGGAPLRFAELLAEELAERERQEPRGQLSTAEAAAIATRRSFYEVRAAHSHETQVFKSEGSTAWTVIYEEDPRLHLSCLNRFIYVKAVADLEDALRGAGPHQGKISTVGIGATVKREQDLATRFGRWGVTRVCPLGRMQQPPITWRHDGRPALGELVTWTDWEPLPRW